jgi:FkbM family methyltransferase
MLRAGLRRHGVDVLAFADNNASGVDAAVDGLPVLHPADAAARFGDEAVFVVAIWGAAASDRMADRIEQLRSLGCRRVISFVPLMWRHHEDFLPHYALDLPGLVLETPELVLEAFRLWDEADSREEYVAEVAWRLTGDFDVLPPPAEHEIYLPPELGALTRDDLFVDCGAFDGDTIRSLVRRYGSDLPQIVALEPDRRSFERLAAYVGTLSDELQERIELHEVAAGRCEGEVSFEMTGTDASKVGEGPETVRLVRLDDLLSDRCPTVLKMDIEGAEPDALEGARETIRRCRPALAVSAYHEQAHLWQVPLLLARLASSHRFLLRPHGMEGWDLVAYAIPRHREQHARGRGVDGSKPS